MFALTYSATKLSGENSMNISLVLTVSKSSRFSRDLISISRSFTFRLLLTMSITATTAAIAANTAPITSMVSSLNLLMPLSTAALGTKPKNIHSANPTG